MSTYKLNLVILVLLLTMVGTSHGGSLVNDAAEYQYVINLATSAQPVPEMRMTSPRLQKYNVYTVTDRTGSAVKYHLRLGFFRSPEEAQLVADELKYQYLDIYIDTLTENEKPVALQWALQDISTQHPLSRTQNVRHDVLRDLYILADHAMETGDYSKATGLYAQIVNAGPNALAQAAQEKLGIAREKNQQYAHAKAEYQKYLDNYPDGEGAKRVQQRLDQLISQQFNQSFSMHKKRYAKNDRDWQHYGYFYQFYYRDSIDSAITGSMTANSSVSSNIHYTAKSISKNRTNEANISASHVSDLTDADIDKERLTSLYYYTSNNRSYNLKLGRQRPKSSGIFNRYDGVDVSYIATPGYNFRLLSGYPVEYNETVDDRSDKYFYSMGLGMVPEHGRWESTIYYLEQKADGLIDRQEIALDAQYLDERTSLFTIFDYSLQYEKVNTFIGSYHTRYNDDAQLTLIANYRRAPFLTTTNALQGQAGVSTLADLLSTLTEDEIEQLSLDRTALYKSLSALYAHDLTTDVQLTTDLTVSNMSGTVSSGGVEALQATGNEYSYAIGLLSSNLFFENDLNIINLRYSELATSNVVLLNLGSRFRPDTSWRINPDIRYDNRDYDDGRSSISIRPSISIENTINRNWEFEARLSYDMKRLNIPGDAITTEKNKLFYAGYIFTF